MINFNKNSAWDLFPIPLDQVRGEVMGLLVNGEQPVMAFKTVRDQLVFTNKRIYISEVLIGRRDQLPSCTPGKSSFDIRR